MENKPITLPLYNTYLSKTLLIDFLSITFIYFLPALSHLTALPLYLIDPMRIAVLFCLIHTNRKNAFLIAVTIPIFSLIVSTHPAIFKSVLITIELLANLVLFYFFIEKLSTFLAMFLSIVLSKLIYYSGKYIFLQLEIIDGDLVSTSLIIQWVVALGLSLYAAIIFNNRQKPKT